MKEINLTQKAHHALFRLKVGLNSYNYAFGGPIANCFRGSYIDSPTEIIIPSDKKPIQIDGFCIEGLNPRAFKRVEYITEDFPIPSKEDTIILLLKSSDIFTSYHIYKNNGIDNKYLIERILEEKDIRLINSAYVALRHFDSFPVSRIEQHVTTFTKEKRAPGITKEDMEFKMAKSYDIPPFNMDIERIINRALEYAEEEHEKVINEHKVKERMLA